jgi:hypothetical protein
MKGPLFVVLRCSNRLRHQLVLIQVAAGWLSSRALLAQPDEQEATW